MKLTFFFSLFCVPLVVTATDSPQNKTLLDQNDAFSNVRLTIQLKTAEIPAASTNILFCCLENNSTNRINFAPNALVVYLTNSAGDYFILYQPEVPRPPKMTDMRPQTTGISFVPYADPGQSNQWSMPLVFNDAIKPGDYQLVANQIVVDFKSKNDSHCIGKSKVHIVK